MSNQTSPVSAWATDLEKADMCERLSFPPEDSRHITVDTLLREYAAVLRDGHAQEAKDTLEVRQHIAWLFQYVQGMNERNWHDMKLRAEGQLEQLSLAFPGPSDTSTVQPQADWNFGDTKPGQLSGPSTKD